MRAQILITPAATLCSLVLLLSGCGSSSSSSASATSPSTSAAAATTTATSSAPASNPPTAGSTTSGPRIGFERVPLEQGPELAAASTTKPAAVDGIQCKPVEQLAYHIHAHLAIFDDGRVYAVPAGVGIPGAQVIHSQQYGAVVGNGTCFFWLHTHTADGVMHIESPTRAIYTLGTFFDVWRQPLTGDRIANLHGKVLAYVNGRPWHRSVRAIPLLSHEDIQLEIGEPIPPIVIVNWKKTAL